MKVQEDSDEKDEPETEEPAWKAGWNLREDHWYYCKEEGKLYLGWIKLKSKWYYLDGENADIMACNEVKKIGDKYYAFDADGVMYTGWIQRPEGWYYAKGSLRNKHTSTTGLYEEILMLKSNGNWWEDTALYCTRTLE